MSALRVTVPCLLLTTLSAGAAHARKPPPAPLCLPADADPRLVYAAGGVLQLCVEDNAPGEVRCFAIELSTGALSHAAAPPLGDDLPRRRALPGAPTISVDRDRVSVCRTTGTPNEPGTGTSCTVISPGEVDPGVGITATLDATGSRAALAYVTDRTRVGIFDAVTGKPQASFPSRSKDLDCASAKMLGDTVLVTERECGGDARLTWLATLAGKRVAEVGGAKGFRAADGPVLVGSSQWAFVSARGDAVVIQDVATGKVKKKLRLGKASSAPVVAVGDGKSIAIVYAGDRLGDLVAIDAKSLAITKHAIARCPK